MEQKYLTFLNFHWKKIIYTSILAVCLLIFSTTLYFWQGTTITYAFLSLSFGLLFYFNVKNRYPAGYVFISLIFWIAFWFKLALHVAIPSLPWMEPVGSFNFSAQGWDQVAIVAGTGVFGFLFGGFLLKKRKKVIIESYVLSKRTKKFKIAAWAFGLGLLSITIFTNEYFQIVHSPIPEPVLNVFWPIQGLFNWFVGGGSSLLLMVPLFYDVSHGRANRAVGLVILASLALAVSIFSRGATVVQSIIIFFTFLIYWKDVQKIRFSQFSLFVLLSVCAIILSVTISQTRRESFLTSVQKASGQFSMSAEKPSAFLNSYSWFLILKLPIERWIGLEGVMAMVSHKGKDMNLLVRAIQERRQQGSLDIYTREIALSPSVDTKTVLYATPPSLFAFWYYSGDLWVVFLGSAFFAFLLGASENIVMHYSRNPFLSAAVGIGIGIQIIHLGTGGLLESGKIFITSLFVALTIGICSRRYLQKKLASG